MKISNQYALDWILANYFDNDDFSRCSTDGCEEIMVMKRAVEALEKQTPKKPFHKSASKYDIFGDSLDGICPCCRKKVWLELQHCDTCGQMLDWSDDV